MTTAPAAGAAPSPSSSTSWVAHVPPEGALRRIDDELRSFFAHLRLTGSERGAQAAFVEHVADLCRKQFLSKGDAKDGKWNGGGRRAVLFGEEVLQR